MTPETLTYTNDSAEVTRAAELWNLYQITLASGRNVLAYGPPGTGKTTAAMFHALGDREAIRHQCKPGETVYDVLGDIGLTNGSTAFRRGTFAIAVETGQRLIVDECDRAGEDVLAMLYSVGDGKPFALADGTVIHPHPRTQVVLTTNADPWEMFPADSGIRDRFPFVLVPEPCAEALETLPTFVRDTARRAVRSGVSGFRAWQHLLGMFGDFGYAPEDLLADVDSYGNVQSENGALVLPSAAKREQAIRLVSGAVFGEHAPEIMRAFRVAATHEHAQAIADARSKPRTNDLADVLVREAYEQGRRDGLAEGLAETEHAHDSDGCWACQRVYESGSEDASSTHTHDSDNDGTCYECDAVYRAGYDSGQESGQESGYESGYEDGQESATHEHDSDNDGTCSDCDAVWSRGYEYVMSTLSRVAPEVIGTDDANAIVDLIRDECE